MVPTGCPETTVRNYHYSLRNNPGEGSPLFMVFHTSRQILGQYVKAAYDHSLLHIFQFIAEIKVKVKVKVTLEQATKAQRGV
jgi:D-arabinose 1-dehydrogenase-like Zn-dependent alcohol dehydrogenase